MVNQVNPYSGLANTGSTGSTSPTGGKELGEDDFLKLVIAQLQNQNPLEPQKDTEFIAQMAQFDTLNQMRELNQAMTVMRGLAELSQASALVGKQVQAVAPSGQVVTGPVSSVSMVNGVPMLDVNGQSIDLYNVQKVMAPPPSATPPA